LLAYLPVLLSTLLLLKMVVETQVPVLVLKVLLPHK
jgi:hypothetical protein